MQVLKLKSKTANSIDLIIKVVTIYCIVMDIEINRVELQILSYFIKYGINRASKDMIIRSHIVKNGSLENAITRIRKKGLIFKDEDKLSVINKDIYFQVENKMGIIIQLENV